MPEIDEDFKSELTPEQKELRRRIASKAKEISMTIVSEKLNELGLTAEGIKLFKDSESIIKSISTEKIDFKELKQRISDFEAKALELQGKFESGHRKQVITEGNYVDGFMKGLRNLWGKDGASFKRLKENSKDMLRVELTTPYTKKGMEALSTKAADNPMSEGTSVVPIGSGIPFSLATFEPGLTRVSRRKPFIVELVNQARTLSAYVAWVEQTNVDPGNAATTAEGGAALAGSFRWTEASTQVKKITHFTKVTKEMLDDLALVENEVRQELIDIIALKLDSQTLKGGGTGNDLKGILQYAQTFTLLGAGVQAPNNYDVLIKAILQIQANGTATPGGEEVINIFEPTDIVLHPSDYTDMKLTKDTLNRYVQQFYPDMGAGDQSTKMGDMLQGLRITTNIGMTTGSFLVMDANKSNVRIREDATIALGYENDDFTKGLVMIRGELRAAHYIKSNHVKAFVSDTFANAKTAIQVV